jgi:hypothetical protein
MDRSLATRHGRESTRHMGYLNNMSCLGAAVEDLKPPKRPLSYAYKAHRRSPFAGASFSLRLAYVPSSASLSQSTHSLVWISDLISMASICSQPITHSYPHASTVKPSFQLSKHPSFSDASLFGCAARFNLSTMEVPASMDGGPFRAPPAGGQSLSPTRAAELSEDGEIFDSDDDDNDDLPTLRQILGSPKQVIEMIDLTCDGEGDSEGDDGNHTEVSWLRYARTAQHRVTLTSTLLNRPYPGRRPTLFYPHRPLCQNHRHTQPAASQHHLQRPHPVGRNILGLIPLRGPSCITNFNGIPTNLLTTRRLMRYTPVRTALGPPRSSSSLHRRTLGLP